jgi:hypothetical protein
LRAVQRLDLGLLVDRQDDRSARRVHVQPDDVGDFSAKHGSLDSLNVPSRCGCRSVSATASPRSARTPTPPRRARRSWPSPDSTSATARSPPAASYGSTPGSWPAPPLAPDSVRHRVCAPPGRPARTAHTDQRSTVGSDTPANSPTKQDHAAPNLVMFTTRVGRCGLSAFRSCVFGLCDIRRCDPQPYGNPTGVGHACPPFLTGHVRASEPIDERLRIPFALIARESFGYGRVAGRTHLRAGRGRRGAPGERGGATCARCSCCWSADERSAIVRSTLRAADQDRRKRIEAKCALAKQSSTDRR